VEQGYDQVIRSGGCIWPTRPSDASGLAFGPSSQQATATWCAIAFTIMILLNGCEQRHQPSFLTRVQQDCANGDRWACGLLTSLSDASRAGR
jgi:hypothetical protein